MGTDLIDKIQWLKKEMADAAFIPAYEEVVCAQMKIHTLENCTSLKNMRYELKVPPKIMALARNNVMDS